MLKFSPKQRRLARIEQAINAIRQRKATELSRTATLRREVYVFGVKQEREAEVMTNIPIDVITLERIEEASDVHVISDVHLVLGKPPKEFTHWIALRADLRKDTKKSARMCLLLDLLANGISLTGV